MKKNNKIGIVSSCGGHLTEIRELLYLYSRYQHFYILNDKSILPADMENITYFITHAERNWKCVINIYEAYKIIKKENPKIFISTGAGIIVPFALLAKIFNIKIIYIETCSSVDKPTLTGKIMYYLADVFYYQRLSLKNHFPNGEYIDSLL